MILERLTLHDFGVYAGRQTITLAPTSKDQPVVLIGGRNGEGKTTILEAVLLALYGPHALSMIGRGGSYDGYLAHSVHRHADAGDGAAVELELQILLDCDPVTLRVCRAWQVRAGRVREQLTVSRNGADDPPLADAWQDFVEMLVPRGVAPLFFFDGERIERLADLDRAAATLKTATGSLLGLDLVDQLATDLRALERRHTITTADSTSRGRLEAAAREVADREEALAGFQQKLAAVRSTLDHKTASLARANERFQRDGGELYERRAGLERDLAAAQADVKDCEDRLRDMAAGDTPLLLAAAALGRLSELARAEHDAHLARAVDDLLEERDATILMWTREIGLLGKHAEELGQRLAADRATRRRRDVEEVALLSPSATRDLDRLTATGFAELTEMARIAIDELEVARAELETAEARLASMPSPDAIRDAMSERAEAQAGLEEAQDVLARLEIEAGAAERERDRSREAHERLLAEIARDGLRSDDTHRILRHSEKARTTLAQLSQLAAGRHMKRIEGLIGESLDELLRKERLIEQVQIDTATHELSLIGCDGTPVPPRGLSAGERQLTALSLLWGLARASGRPLPVIIDTPLGRLDRTHRHLLVERYLPRASHQVIVLSTDTEVDGQTARLLDGAVGRRYRLEHDDGTQSTRFVEGYFADQLEVAA